MKISNKHTFQAWRIHLLGDHAIVFSLTEIIDTSINEEIHAFNFFIHQKNINAFKDYIPAYHSLTIVYDIIELHKNFRLNLLDFAQQLLNEFEACKNQNIANPLKSKIHRIPVCYNKDFGWDLENICKEKNISIEQLIQLHTSKIYQVFCLGFLPGFAYMGTVDKMIQVARHSKPRGLVDKGSIGIAGAQTGIYPKDSPGGWQIIGKTPIPIFDSIKFALFAPGEQVSFYAISMKEFNDIKDNLNNVY